MLKILNSNTEPNIDPFSSISKFEEIPNFEIENVSIIESEINKDKLFSSICLNMQNKIINIMSGKSTNQSIFYFCFSKKLFCVD